MPRRHASPLMAEMLEAYRPDLERAIAHWWTCTVAVSTADRGTPEQLQAASALVQAQAALDGAHPFLHRQFLTRLKELVVARRSTRAGADVQDPFEAAEVTRLVAQVLLEAEQAGADDAGAVHRHLVVEE